MSDVRIYQPAKNAMQSGRVNTQKWVLEFEPGCAKQADPLMGWIGSTDTRDQVCMKFSTKEQAVAFAEKNGLSYRVQDPCQRRLQPKSYAARFAFDRVR